jgi:hypothetical protein
MLQKKSMTLLFKGNDFGPFVLGRSILGRFPKADISFVIGGDKEIKNSEESLWNTAIQKISTQHTRFGRIGISYDRKNKNAKDFCLTLSQSKIPYTPQDFSRAEQLPILSFFETQVLYEMANEGLADTVEFRRLARKFIRKIKHAHIDSILFLETIFGEEETKKILQHIAGTQIQVFVSSDFLALEDIKEGKTRTIKITTEDDPDFTHQRAEEILKTKISKLS